MNYPDVYSEIDANEMVYIVGGSPDYMGLFNYLIGNYLRDAVLSDARSAVWNSAKKGSLTPMEDWMKNFWNMNIFAKTGYLYGVFRLGETIMGYLNMIKSTVLFLDELGSPFLKPTCQLNRIVRHILQLVY